MAKKTFGAEDGAVTVKIGHSEVQLYIADYMECYGKKDGNNADLTILPDTWEHDDDLIHAFRWAADELEREKARADKRLLKMKLKKKLKKKLAKQELTA